MNILCEMEVFEFFKLSSGDIALAGEMKPNSNKFIFESKADLYIDGNLIKKIILIGEDIFSGGDREKRANRRAVRTKDDIHELLSNSLNNIKLIIYDK